MTISARLEAQNGVGSSPGVTLMCWLMLKDDPVLTKQIDPDAFRRCDREVNFD
jgi:hypothetical protein